MSGAHSGVRSNEYNLTAVRELLLAAFTDSGLRRFCLDDPRFRFVCDHFGEQFSHYKLVDTLIRQCLRVGLLSELLPAIEKENPRQFERFSVRLLGPSEPDTLDALFPGPFQAPPLPAHFVPRPEVSEAVKAALLAGGEAPGVLVVGAIQGLGGIGKSVLAAALAHDPQVRASFPDGVLWATLGQEPETLSLLAGWLREGLSDYDYQPLRVEDATLHLRTLLQDKACLLVIDDVWDPAVARPFLAGGAQCRALLTTRRADVADVLAADLFFLDLMTDEQSLALLAARLGRPLAGREQTEALRVARAVGNLPLALELAAARVARGVAWSELCAALKAEVARLEALESARDRRGQPRLEAAFRLSLDALRAEDPRAWQAFVWLGVLPEDVTVAAPAAAMLWAVTAAEADDLLELLWSDALLLPGSPVFVAGRSWRGYRLHDLLRAVACRLLESAPPNGLGLTLPQVHAALLDRYRTQARDGLWHTLPDDVYIHDHLTWHMAQAGWEDEIHALLQEETSAGRNGWYEARERLGQTGGYLADVSRAWRLAESQVAETGGAGLVCRYALIVASLNSLAGNVGPELITALVGEGIWSAARGLAYARQIPYLSQCVAAMAGLAPHLPEEQRAKVLGEALARAIGGGKFRSSALRTLAPHLPEGLLVEALTAARAIEDEKSRGWALAGLGPYLPTQLLRDALAEAQSIENELARAEALLRLAPYLPGEQCMLVLQEPLVVADEKSYAEILTGLAPRLPAWMLGKLLTAAQAMQDEQYRASALVGLAPHLPEGLKRQALSAAQAIQYEKYRASALEGLAPHLPEGLLGEALTAARAIEDADARGWALAGLAPYLPEGQCAEVLEEAVAVGRASKNKWSRWRILIRLVPYLPEEQRTELLGEALAAVQPTKEGSTYVDLLVELAPHLPEKQRAEALQETLATKRAIRDQKARTQAIGGLGAYLPEKLWAETLAPARTIEYAEYRAEALAVPWLYLPEGQQGEMLEETLAAAWAIKDEGKRSYVLEKLAPQLPEGLLGKALTTARAMESEQSRAGALAGLAPHLPGRLLGEALTTARAIEDADARGWALAGLVPHLPERQRAEVLGEALAAGRAIRDERQRARALAGLVPHLPEAQQAEALGEVLAAVQAIRDETGLVGDMFEVSSSLPARLRGEVFAMAQAIEDASTRGQTLARLAPHLPEELLGEALAAVLAIKEQRDFGWSLVSLAPRLPARLLGEALSAARAIESEQYRAGALAGLGPYLPEGLLGEALAAARAIESERYRGQALAGLAPYLPEGQRVEVLGEAVAAGRATSDEGSRAHLLVELAPHLSEGERVEVLGEALAAARAIELDMSRESAIAGLRAAWVALPRASLGQLWNETLRESVACRRDHLLSDLSALAPVLATLGGELAVVETILASQDVGRWWP